MTSPPTRGLPPRIAIPILVIVAVVFLSLMAYFLRIGFGVTGSPFGADANAPGAAQSQGPRSTK